MNSWFYFKVLTNKLINKYIPLDYIYTWFRIAAITYVEPFCFNLPKAVRLYVQRTAYVLPSLNCPKLSGETSHSSPSEISHAFTARVHNSACWPSLRVTVSRPLRTSTPSRTIWDTPERQTPPKRALASHDHCSANTGWRDDLSAGVWRKDTRHYWARKREYEIT